MIPSATPSVAPSVITVLLVDDEHLIRTALVQLLSLEAGLEVVGEAATGDEAVAAIRRLRPDVVVLDLQLPDRDGISVYEEVSADGISDGGAPAGVMLTSHGRPGYLKRALAAGIQGFLPKTSSAEVLARAIRTVHGGGRFVDPELAADAITSGDSPLTAREADVLEAGLDGAPVEVIARRTHLSPGTVRNYLSSAAAKLGARNRHEAMAAARRLGWI